MKQFVATIESKDKQYNLIFNTENQSTISEDVQAFLDDKFPNLMPTIIRIEEIK